MSVKKILFSVIVLVLCYVKGHVEKSSLAFVIDRTSSMHKEIAQVKKATDNVFKSVIYSNTSIIDNFILVTFDDPGFHLLTNTRDKDKFKKALSEIVLVKGGDCPEASMSGIELALRIVNPNSFVYVFTDASASDYDRMEVVKSLSQKKSTQVNFLLTGVCKWAKRETFVVYEEIAEATSGYVFNITKDDVSKVLDFVSHFLKSKNTILSRKVFEDKSDQQLQFTIDSKVSDVYICASSSTPDITILDSAGNKVDVVIFISTEKNKIFKLKNEIRGVYFIKLNTKEKTLVTVSASTAICFQHGFSTVLPTSLEETSINPSGKITDKYFLSIKFNNSARDILLETVQLVDAYDNIIRTEQLKIQNEEEQFYVTEPFDVPDKSLRIAINGLTKSKEKITRVTTTTVEYPDSNVVEMENEENVPPKVTILGDSHIKLEHNHDTSIKCLVLAIPTPNITWIDDNGEFHKSKVEKLDSPKYLSILDVKKAVKNVKLTCRARNEEGQDEKTVTLEVKKNKFLKILEYPKDIKIRYKKSEELRCKVDAYPPAEISWYRNKKKLSNDENFVIAPDNTTLRIKQMQPHLKGEYYVEISNEVRTEKKIFNVFTDGTKPVIDKRNRTYVTTQDLDQDIYCSILKGEPQPVIKWMYKKFIDSSEVEKSTKSSVYHFRPAKKEDNGIYICIAENDLGNDTFEIEVVVQYGAKILRTTSNVKKVVGKSLTLPCSVSGIPRPTVNWFFNNITKIEKYSSKYTISGKNDLIFNVTLAHEGIYSCRAKNTIAEDTYNINVVAIELPTIEPPASSLITLKAGELLNLSCIAHGHPEPTIKWKFQSSDEKQQEIVISKVNTYNVEVQLHDAGMYICEASNTPERQDYAQMSICVQIAAAPEFYNMDHILEGVVGDLVLRVPCKTRNIPMPTITWEYKTNERAKGNTITEGIDSSKTLVLIKITKNTEGLYKCIAKNAYGTASHEYKIRVKDFPYPSIKDTVGTTVLIEEGKSGTHQCPYHESPKGEYYIRWYKDYEIIKNCTNTSCTLELSNMSRTDSGIYTCRVSTIDVSYTKYTRIVVGFKPRFMGEAESIISFKENGHASLDCRSYAEPAPKVTWYLEEQILLKSTDLYIFNMTVDSVGKYKCIVSNDFGTIRRDFEIRSDSVCEVNIAYKRNMPLLLTRNFTWILTNRVPINSDIEIDCTEHDISDGKRKFNSPLYATCIEKTIFKTKTNEKIDISKLKCDRPIELVIRTDNNPCIKGESKLLQVGFQSKTTFLNVYDVCIDTVKNHPCFIKYFINEYIANSSPKELVHYVESSYLQFKFEDLYDCNKQVGSIFAKTGVNISEGNKCCYARKQLVSPKDMLPGLPQLATYNYVNVIPQWSTCGTENWDEVERRVRSLAISRRITLEVWTGSFESIKLPNQDTDNYVTINDKYDRAQRVPRYIWKLVISKQYLGEKSTKEGLAIVIMNSPNLKEGQEQIPCKRDICNETKWMFSSQWRDSSKGFVFCCNLTDFMSTFNYINLFPSMKPLK